jgi:hypothetical protein
LPWQSGPGEIVNKRERLRRFVMLTDQGFLSTGGSMSNSRVEVPSRTSEEFVRTYDAQVHKIIDAIAAVVANAQAGSNWLQVQPLNPEEIRQALNSIAKDGKRACELVIRLRVLMHEGAQLNHWPK